MIKKKVNPKLIPICIFCGVRPVLIKKRGMCSCCYQKNRAQEMAGKTKNIEDSVFLSKQAYEKHEHESELRFVQNYPQPSALIHHPAKFNLNPVESYTPDFYDTQRNVFIEVAGTRQAFYHNENKYILFKQIFPFINFEVLRSNGQELSKNADGHYFWTREPNTNQVAV